MKRASLGITALLATHMAGSPQDVSPIIHCQYGVPARFVMGILDYPDFTLHFTQRIEHFAIENGTPWVTYRFRVIDSLEGTGGEIVFNSDQRANGRRFDALVVGKIFVAEMYSSTARSSEKGSDSCSSKRLPQGTIVVWSEESARLGNPVLHKIWETESIKAGAAYSSHNAYANGVLLQGYTPEDRFGDDGLKRLVGDPPHIERVQVLGRDGLPHSPNAIRGEFGTREPILRIFCRYPGFTLACTEVDVTTAFSERDEVVPGNWTGRIVKSKPEIRSRQCPRNDVSITLSSKRKLL